MMEPGGLGSSATIALHIHDRQRTPNPLQRIAARCWRVLVRHVAVVTELRQCLRDEVVIQFLMLIDLMTPGNAGGMHVGDPLNVVPKVPADVAVLNLYVIDVEQQLHAR